MGNVHYSYDTYCPVEGCPKCEPDFAKGHENPEWFRVIRETKWGYHTIAYFLYEEDAKEYVDYLLGS